MRVLARLRPAAGLTLLAALTTLAPACGAPEASPAAPAEAPADGDEDDPLLETKALSSNQPGRPAVKVGTGDGTTRVWTVTADWSDTTTPAARKAGMAWTEDSGLRWDEKYARWVESMSAARAGDGKKTLVVTTPYGRSLPLPLLECSEAALLLRALFASWYGLPFFVEAYDGKQTIYLGHFGFVTRAGARYAGMPQFERAYADHSARAATAAANYPANWPRDEALRRKHLTALDDNDWLAAGSGFGRWADEMVLNKRVGWFLVYLMDWFGSMNLADASNAFHIQPRSIAPGDFLLERWRAIGTGHTLVVNQVNDAFDGKLEVNVLSGSIPRRQPWWMDPLASRDYFLRDKSGGYGKAADGRAFASLGGGLRRFRVAVRSGGYWRNDVPAWDKPIALVETDLEAIARRTREFATLLVNASPESRRDYLVAQLELARSQLRQHPASCTNRTDRESYFAELSTLMRDKFGVAADETIRRYRKREDFFFPELVYDKSPTCCWNTTTPAMFAIIERYNREREAKAQQCLAPVAFQKSTYGTFRAFAQSIGRGAEFGDWSRDEECPQAGNSDDTRATSALPAYCAVRDAIARN